MDYSVEFEKELPESISLSSGVCNLCRECSQPEGRADLQATG